MVKFCERKFEQMKREKSEKIKKKIKIIELKKNKAFANLAQNQNFIWLVRNRKKKLEKKAKEKDFLIFQSRKEPGR